ncbi:fatty-acid-binding protein 3, chloroplastic [Cucurbita maxima]|uniref:Fatty-acid-binding protein 3, chloroplastic n=1 Tax=Cucurbita maxima TaxID=3661 RepID=A0A6J1IK66_CUCMA|nr:fatty-acid-binding protein 3, chloroplastic [Cucurbita maxima]
MAVNAVNAVNPTPLRLPSAIPTGKWISNARVCLPRKPPTQSTSSFNKNFRSRSNFSLKPSSSSLASVGNAGYVEEPSTNVKFSTSFTLPGCSTSLSLLGTAANISGYREKVFAIIGVKVYAAGLYINSSISNELNAWRGRSAAAIQEDSSLFNIIFQCNNHYL